MKRWRVCVLAALSILIMGGCKTTTENEVKQDARFPETIYMEADRVTVDCKLEIDDGSRNQQKQLPGVDGKIYTDAEKAYQTYVAEKEVKEEHHDEGSDGWPDSDSYIFLDGGTMTVGSTFAFGTANSKYYFRAGTTKEENVNEYAEHPVSFMSGEEAVDQVKKTLKDLGYPEEEFYFSYYSLNWETMKNVESRYADEGLIEAENIKDEWSEEDDAYLVYAFQKASDLPVYHQMMSITHELAFDTVDSAPVQAIYSTRGFEWMYISNIYDFEGENEVQLQNIDNIIHVVTDKYNALLNDSTYLVNRAKLYVRVYLDENQDYKTSLIWYFEVQDDSGKKEVMLVDAVSGKEIYLP